MNKKRAVEVYTSFRDVLNNSGLHKKLVKQLLDFYPSFVERVNAVSVVPSVMFEDTEWAEKYPEITDKGYIIPALVSSVINASSDGRVDELMGAILKEDSTSSDKRLLAMLAIHFALPFLNTNRYLDRNAHSKYVIKDSTWEKKDSLGGVLKFRVQDILDKVKTPYVFIRDGFVIVIYPSVMWSSKEEAGSTVRVEEFKLDPKGKGETGMVYLDVYSPEGSGVETIGDLVDFYVDNDRVLGLGSVETTKQLTEYLKYILLLECKNIVVPEPEEFNEVRSKLLRSGKKSQAAKHPSWRFVDIDGIKFVASSPTKCKQGNSTGRTVAAHMRRGHFRGVWCGTKNNQKLEIRWISPTMVNSDSTKENRVFYVI